MFARSVIPGTAAIIASIVTAPDVACLRAARCRAGDRPAGCEDHDVRQVAPGSGAVLRERFGRNTERYHDDRKAPAHG
jgi:hypothetical protein